MASNVYYVGGRMAAASGTTARNAAAQLWNPHANKRINVREIWIANTAATAAQIAIARSTAIGATFGVTVTPDLDNGADRDVAPPSGFVLHLSGFGTQPTVDASDLVRWNLPASIGSGVIIPFAQPIVVPPGTGLCIVTATAAALPISDITYVVED